MQANSSKDDHSAEPRFGVFVVMMLGLLLFFGMVSRVGKLETPDTLSGYTQQKAAARESKLNKEKDRAFAIIGGDRPLFSRPEGVDPSEIFSDFENETNESTALSPTDGTDGPSRSRNLVTPPKRTARVTNARNRFYVVQPGDTLYRIATAAYGDGKMWRQIYDANPGLKTDSIRVNMRLVIPTANSTGNQAADASGTRRSSGNQRM